MSDSPLGDVAKIGGEWFVRDPHGKVVAGPFATMGLAAGYQVRTLIARTPATATEGGKE